MQQSTLSVARGPTHVDRLFTLHLTRPFFAQYIAVLRPDITNTDESHDRQALLESP